MWIPYHEELDRSVELITLSKERLRDTCEKALMALNCIYAALGEGINPEELLSADSKCYAVIYYGNVEKDGTRTISTDEIKEAKKLLGVDFDLEKDEVTVDFALASEPPSTWVAKEEREFIIVRVKNPKTKEAKGKKVEVYVEALPFLNQPKLWPMVELRKALKVKGRKGEFEWPFK